MKLGRRVVIDGGGGDIERGRVQRGQAYIGMRRRDGAGDGCVASPQHGSTKKSPESMKVPQSGREWTPNVHKKDYPGSYPAENGQWVLGSLRSGRSGLGGLGLSEIASNGRVPKKTGR